MNSSFAFRVAQSQNQSNIVPLAMSARSVFLQVARYNRLQNDVNGVKKALHDKISVAFSAFSLTAQQTSTVELHSTSQTEAHLVRPAKRTAGHTATSHPKRMCLASSSPARVTVCLFA